LTGFGFGLGMAADILRQGTTHIVTFIKLSFGIAADVALIPAGIDQFAFSRRAAIAAGFASSRFAASGFTSAAGLAAAGALGSAAGGLS
jgi:hypothetical protein